MKREGLQRITQSCNPSFFSLKYHPISRKITHFCRSTKSREKSIAKGVGEGSETPEKKNPSESVKVRIWLFRHRQVSRDFFLKSLDRQQRWRPRTSNRNYWWYSLSIYDMYLLQLIMVPPGKDLTEHGRRYNNSEFWRLLLKRLYKCSVRTLWNLKPSQNNIHYFENIGHTWYISLNCTLLLLWWNWALRINTIQWFTEK